MPDKILEIELISIQNKKNQNNFRAWSNSVQIHKVEYSPLYREELIGHKELAKLQLINYRPISQREKLVYNGGFQIFNCCHS